MKPFIRSMRRESKGKYQAKLEKKINGSSQRLKIECVFAKELERRGERKKISHHSEKNHLFAFLKKPKDEDFPGWI